MNTRADRLFRGTAMAFLLAFCLSVLLLLAADAAYIDGRALRDLFTSPALRHALRLSFVTSIAATLLSLLTAIPSAYALSRQHVRGIGLLDLIVDLLIVMPVLVIGISLLVVFRVGGDLAGAASPLARAVGTAVDAIGNVFIYTPAGIVLAQYFCAVGFVIRTLKTAFDAVDRRMEQVALTLGCSEGCAFRRITFPLARHGLLAAAALGWLRAFGVFGAVIIVGGAVRNRTEVLPTAIYLEISIGRLERAIAISLLMVVSAAVVLVLLRIVFGASLFGSKHSP